MQAIFGKSRLARPKLAKRAKDGAQEKSAPCFVRVY
jgi:hypothetical protein